MSVLASGTPITDADPFAPEILDDPWPLHERLREAGPVVRLSRYGAWAVARHAEVRATLTDWRRFCSGRGVGLSDFAREPPWRPPSLVLETDPPEHDRARAVLARALAPKALRGQQTFLDAAADRLVDRLLRLGTFDAVPELAEAYPLDVFPALVGLGEGARENLLPYGNLAFNAFGPRNALLASAIEDSKAAVAWIAEAVRPDALAPGGFGAAIHGAAETGEVTPAEATLLVRSLLTAGVDTTVNGLAAAILCLASNPDEFQRLRDEPALARNAFEEAVRLESPVQTFFRTTTCPVEIGGAGIGEGEKVLMLLGSANRDPRRWEAPDRYDIARNTAGHVGYGAGVHMCVGMLLARLEGEAVLGALARRVTGLELAGPVRRRRNNTLRGVGSLPIRLLG